MKQKIKMNLSMILIKKLNESGVENAPLFSKNETKKYLPAGKMGFRAFALNSEKGVKTPSWRIMGIKNDPHYSEQINCSGFLVLRFASTRIFEIYKWDI